jgi:hypothetical protein
LDSGVWGSRVPTRTLVMRYAKGLGFRVWGLGFRVQGLGYPRALLSSSNAKTKLQLG